MAAGLTISTTCCRTISSIMAVVSGVGSPVSPETNIICFKVFSVNLFVVIWMILDLSIGTGQQYSNIAIHLYKYSNVVVRSAHDHHATNILFEI